MTKKIYLDYQATTPVDPQILKKMIPYFSENFGNPHSNNHEFGRKVNEDIENARLDIAKLINAKKEEIIFTSGATESNNLAIKSIAKNYFQGDFQIITCQTEHKCVLESCYEIEKENVKSTYLSVSEDGLINLEELENLFQPFKKLSSNPTGEEKGTGLGLAIAKKMVELHHGVLTLKSSKDHGANFSFELPTNPITPKL